MDKKNIILIIIIIIIIIIITCVILYNKNIKKTRFIMLKNIVDSKNKIIINNKKLDLPITNKGLGFTLSLCINIDNWDYNYDKRKYIIKWDNCNIWLEKKNNSLYVSVPIFNQSNQEIITYKNIKLQKWINIIIILDNRNLDLWINGQLINSKYLNNVPNLKHNNLLICPKGGFSGKISNIVYYSYPLDYSSFLGKNTIKNLVSNKPAK